MSQKPVTQEQAVRLVEKLRQASQRFERDQNSADAKVALCDARNDVVRAKKSTERYLRDCPLSETAHVSYIVATLEQAIDTIIA